MPKNELRKHTLNLRKDDFERLQSMFPDVGASVVIRRLVATFIDSDDTVTKTEIATKEIEL